jgi:hypothetical protein
MTDFTAEITRKTFESELKQFVFETTINQATLTGASDGKVSLENDATTDFLENKIVAGTGITLDVLDNSGVKTLEISSISDAVDWGNITGNLSDQTDLQNALDSKASTTSLSNHVNNTNNPHSVTKTQIGLSNIDNTSDLNKPISTATQTALDSKVDKVTGKGLSTNDYTTTEKDKLAGIQAGAEVNVNADWDATSGDAQILNKPTIPDVSGKLNTDQTSPQNTTGKFTFPQVVVDGTNVTGNQVIQSIKAGTEAGDVLNKKQYLSVDTNPVSLAVDNAGYAWIAYQGGKNIKTYDISAELPVYSNTISLSNFPTCLYYNGNYLFLTSVNGNYLEIYDVSNRLSPSLVSSTLISEAAYSVITDPYNLYAYVLTLNKLRLFDISDKSNPSLIDTYSFPVGTSSLPNALSFYVDNNSGNSYLYAAFDALGTYIFDVTSATLSLLSSVSIAHNSTVITYKDMGNNIVAMLSASLTDNRVYVYDVSNQSSPSLISSFSTQRPGFVASYPSDIKVSGNYAYISMGDSKAVDVYDVSNPYAVSLYARGDTGAENSNNVELYNGYVYVATMTNQQFQVFKLESGNKTQTGNIWTISDNNGYNLAYFDGNAYLTTGNISGLNTGDETETTIKSKLGITTLSGSNTGDQDLSPYALTSNIPTVYYSKSFVITNPTASKSFAVWKTPTAITITAVHGVQVGGTNVIGILTECDADGLNPAVIDTTDITVLATNVNKTSFTNPSIDAGDYVGWNTTSVSGNVTKLIITFEYTI